VNFPNIKIQEPKPSANFPSVPETKPMFTEGQVPKQYPSNIADVLHDHTKLLANAQQARGGANFPHANLLKGRF